jgi:ribonuclease Z
MLRDDIGYRLAHHEDLTWEPPVEVTEITDADLEAGGVVLSDPDLVVTAAATNHAPVHPTLGYRVELGGASAVIGGDGIPCPGLDQLCRGASVYVQTVVRPSLVEGIPSARLQDILDYHSSVADAGRTAARGRVDTLVLNHPVPPPFPGTEQEWIDEAAAEFEGAIFLADDLLTIKV